MTRRNWRRAAREVLRRAEDEPLAGIFGWTLVACGWALWMTALLPVPWPLGGLCAFEAWVVTTAGGPLVVLSEAIKKRRNQGAGR